jgi:hypothetical protein
LALKLGSFSTCRTCSCLVTTQAAPPLGSRTVVTGSCSRVQPTTPPSLRRPTFAGRGRWSTIDQS